MDVIWFDALSLRALREYRTHQVVVIEYWRTRTAHKESLVAVGSSPLKGRATKKLSG